MSNLFRRILVNQSTRIIFLIFLFVVTIVLYFLITAYFNQIRLYEQIQYDRMNAIARTLSMSVDGDTHQSLFETYKKKDAIKTNEQDSNYEKIHLKLKQAEKENKTGSTIYTIVYDPINSKFEYGVSSSMPFFRHEYVKYPEVLKKEYRKGAVIPRYTTENGTWISAFAPVYNTNNQVVAVVEADVKFNEFIEIARAKVFKNLGISLGIILIIALFLYRSVKKILRQEEKMKKTLIEQKKEIEEINKDITDSINYAKKIQDAILPTQEQIKSSLKNSFILFKPRDIVSGDFYWHHCFDNGAQIFAVGDCTGHGIPGALVSVIGSSLLNEIVKQRKEISPAKILEDLDRGVNHSLGNDAKSSDQRDGMDISICYIDEKQEKIHYAGAFRPLILIRHGEMIEYKGSRFPIGGGDLYEKDCFEEIEIIIEKGDTYYMFSDGFPDQFGGPNGKKLMTKKFKHVLMEIIHMHFDDQCLHLENFITEWRGHHPQNDDVLVVGFSFS